MDYFGNNKSMNSPELAISVALVMASAEKFIIDYGVCQGGGVIVSSFTL